MTSIKILPNNKINNNNNNNNYGTVINSRTTAYFPIPGIYHSKLYCKSQTDILTATKN